YVDAGHKGTEGLAADLGAARNIVDAMPVPPTVLIGTGGGVQAHWCFPTLMSVDECPIDLHALCEGWVRLAQTVATGRGAANAVDSVGNIDRILRVPGTLNRKLADPRAITILEVDWNRRYTPQELASLVTPGASRPKTMPRAATEQTD